MGHEEGFGRVTQQSTKKEEIMPFVSIRILEGHPQELKDAISRKVTEAICEETKLPKEAVWVVFEDISAKDWYVGQRSVASMQPDRKP
jgi:4-oxalocrotonate tautomerase